ncbi:MAG: hypothetical protein ABW019_11800 [Chitinophagaceae bacterium]
MMQTQYPAARPVHRVSAVKPILTGAGIALSLIVVFLLGVNNADPAWGKYWMIRPLLIVPLAGAGGGLFYYLMDRWRPRFGWNRIVVIIVSVIAYIIGLWIGTILGLDGTYWN